MSVSNVLVVNYTKLMKMKIKYTVLLALILTFSSTVFAEDGKFYIYGKCTLVENTELEGFISIKGDKLWISQFISTKLDNPYAKLFPTDGSIRFGENRNYLPATHSFICRYNDIKQLRPIAKDRLEITIKNNRSIDVEYNFENTITIQLPDGTTKILNWETIAKLSFMQAPQINPRNYPKLKIGSVESTQGIYFGVIQGLNYSNQIVPIQITQGADENIDFSEIDKLECNKDRQVNITIDNILLNADNFRVKKSLTKIRVNLSTMGSIDVPWERIKSIKRSDLNEFQGATYESSIEPKRLNGEVKLNYKQNKVIVKPNEVDVEAVYATHIGPLAYDLDEALNIEFIEGRNDGIIYRLMLDGIKSIEPKNYNYSLIHMKNGSKLSLGADHDVSFKNDGILMLNTKSYIPWRYIDIIHFND